MRAFIVVGAGLEGARIINLDNVVEIRDYPAQFREGKRTVHVVTNANNGEAPYIAKFDGDAAEEFIGYLREAGGLR